MSNKPIVEKYMAGFNEGDHSKILSCLTEDVIWEMHGQFYKSGLEEFDKEIENEAFTGRPTIKVLLLIEEGNFVVAEGSVQCMMKSGDMLDAMFCDVFHFENGKIKKLTSYMMNK